MLVPAITRRDEIFEAASELYYTEDYFYYIGDPACYPIKINDTSELGEYTFASVDKKGKLVGYIAYRVDFYIGCAYDFGLISFDKGNLTLAKDLEIVMKDIMENPAIRRVEWKAVVPNPVIKSYRRFCKKYHGTEFEFHDCTRDSHGKWHNEIIFEIMKDTEGRNG